MYLLISEIPFLIPFHVGLKAASPKLAASGVVL